MEFSINIKGCRLCSNSCNYCSAPTVLPSEERNFQNEVHEIDYVAMEKTMRSNPLLQNAIKNKETITLNLWGGNPLDHTEELEEIMEWYKEVMSDFWKFNENSKPQFYISTGGAPLRRKSVRDWVDRMVADTTQKLDIQLSHDGIGNYIRDSKKYDPLYDKDVGPWLVKLVKNGTFTMINATLHKFNNSHFANIFYFNKWRYDNHIEKYKFMIKNNHMNDADYCKGFDLRGEELREYFHELELVFQQAYLADPNDLWWSPYKEYYINQMKRWEMYKGPGGCGQFSTGMRDYTWCMNTLGEYVMCQLFDSNEGMPNPKLERPEAYLLSKYSNYDEMHPCPDMSMSPDPDYKVEYIRCVLRMKHFIRIVDELVKRGEVPTPKKQNCNGKNCNCGEPQRKIYTGDISARLIEY